MEPKGLTKKNPKQKQNLSDHKRRNGNWISSSCVDFTKQSWPHQKEFSSFNFAQTSCMAVLAKITEKHQAF